MSATQTPTLPTCAGTRQIFHTLHSPATRCRASRPPRTPCFLFRSTCGLGQHQHQTRQLQGIIWAARLHDSPSVTRQKKKPTTRQKCRKIQGSTYKRFLGERHRGKSRFHARPQYLTSLRCTGQGVGSPQGQKAAGDAEDEGPSLASMRMGQKTVRSLQLQLLKHPQNKKRKR